MLSQTKDWILFIRTEKKDKTDGGDVMGVWIEGEKVYKAKFRCKLCGKEFEYIHYAEYHVIREHFDKLVEVIKDDRNKNAK